MTMRDRVVEAYERHAGNVSAVSRELGINRSTVRHHLRKAGIGPEDKPLAGGKLEATKVEQRSVPRTGVKRYILTSAQNNTYVNEAVWNNLMALAEHYQAEVLCASYSYNINAYGKLAVKRGTAKSVEEELWFDDRVRPFLERSDQNIELAPGLVWCGRMNTMPTAVRPLSGFETYTGRKSGIFPHAKLAMESVASGKGEGTKMNYTTGTVTQRNYIQKKAGLRAEHYHSYGGLVVEVDAEGRWFVRQLVADDDGTIQDLDVVVSDGKVKTGQTVEAITWGDVHVASLDPEVRRLSWGPGGMLDTLKPRFQFLHDLLDFRARNHHDRNDPHKRFALWLEGRDRISDEVAETARFLHEAHRDWCHTVVVDSNHDNALLRWLKETDWRADPPNAEFYLEAQLRVLQAIREGDTWFHVVEWALRRADAPAGTRFLREDESFVICRDRDGGIECGMHGHLGPNGTRGTPLALSRMGRKANTGHTHSAGILDGMYVAGCSTKLDVGYNKGPSSWSHSHIVTYPNGKRAIVTMWDGKWRA